MAFSHSEEDPLFRMVESEAAVDLQMYPRFGSRAGSFLTQRRKDAEKRVFFMFLRVIFIFATPYKRHPIGEDSLCQKNSCIFHFPAELHFFLCITLHLCDSALKSTAVFRFKTRESMTVPGGVVVHM